jgi:hypothetical protein
VQSDRGEVGVAEVLGDLDRLGCGLVRPVVVPGSFALEDDLDQEPALLGALSPFSLDETLGPAEPTACRS